MSTTNHGQMAARAPDRGGPANAAEELAHRRHSPAQRVQHMLHAHPAASPTLLLLATAIVFTTLNARFADPSTLSLLVQQTAIIAGLALGQTLIILIAGIDLSIGAITVLSVMVSAKLAADNGVPGPLAILIGVGVGMTCGCVNGALVTKIKLPPFIVTLGTLSIFTAIVLLYTHAVSFQSDALPSQMLWTGERIELGPINITTGVLMVGLLYLVVGFALTQTAWGRHVYSVGDDAEASRLAGISVNRVLFSVYAVAGVIYGVMAWVLIGRAGAASPNLVSTANLDTITAVVIGGTSLFGGRGGVLGTLMGALTVGSFTLGLSLIGVDDQYRVLAVGVLVIAAVSVDQWIRQVKS